MNKCFYHFNRKTADILFVVSEFLVLVIFITTVIAGELLLAAATAVSGLLYAFYRYIKGPLVGLAILEVSNEELIWRLNIYIPRKIQRIKLGTIKTITIVGPVRDRRFRIDTVDGSRQEIRPYFGLRTPKAVLFLKNKMPESITFIEEAPSGFMSQMRGDY